MSRLQGFRILGMIMSSDKLTRWIKGCRKHVRQDYDNVILFSGKEGDGKSSVALQILRALDDDFNLRHLHQRVLMTTNDFLKHVRHVPPYGAILMDEALFRNRKGMTKGTINFLDYLQICRGRNHHIGLCFPHAYRLDKAILDDRVKWNCHIPRRGLLQIRKRELLEVGDDMIGQWSAPLIEADTYPNKGPFWEAYLRLKGAHMASIEVTQTPLIPEY